MPSFQQSLSNASRMKPDALAQAIQEHGISIIPELHKAEACFGELYGALLVPIVTELGIELIPVLHEAGTLFESLDIPDTISIITQLGSQAIPALHKAGMNFSRIYEDSLASLVTDVGASSIPALIKAGADIRWQHEGALMGLSKELQLSVAQELQNLPFHYLCAADALIFQEEAQSALDQALIQASCPGAPQAVMRTLLKLLKANDLPQLSKLYAYHQPSFSNSFFDQWMQEGLVEVSHYTTQSTDTWNQVGEKLEGNNEGGIFAEPSTNTSYLVKAIPVDRLASAVMGAAVARSILGDAYAPLDRLAYCGDKICLTSKMIPGFNTTIYNPAYFMYNSLSTICSGHPTHLNGLDAASLVDWIVQHNDLHAGNSGIIQDSSGSHITIIDFDFASFPTEREHPIPCNKQAFKVLAQQWLATDVQALILEQFTAIATYIPQQAPQLLDFEASLLASQRDLAEFLASAVFLEADSI